LTYSPQEARIFVGRLTQKKRAAFELRSRGVWTEESALPQQHVRKKRKLDPQPRRPSLSPSETESEHKGGGHDVPERASATSDALLSLEDHVVVLKLKWLTKSLEAGAFLPPDPYLVYVGRVVERHKDETPASDPPSSVTYIKATQDGPGPSSPQAALSQKPGESSLTSILDGTKLSSSSPPQAVANSSPRRFRDQKYGHRSTFSSTHPALHRMTTSEHDFLDPANSSLPPPPAWMLEPHPRANTHV